MSGSKILTGLSHQNPVTVVKNGFQTLDDLGGHDFGHTITSLHSFVSKIVFSMFDCVIDSASWNLFNIEVIDGELFTL